MRVLLLEPFFAGSHAAWANGLQANSAHEVTIWSLPGRHWKWRMHGAAVSFAERMRSGQPQFDAILATDMLNLGVFAGMCREQIAGKPIAMYFHENQLSYPWSPQDRDVRKGRDLHYGFINWTTALTADAVWFNSAYNRDSFFEGVRRMLKAMPDKRENQLINGLQQRSRIIPLGIGLEPLFVPAATKDLSEPVLLWNHRWEYDKAPGAFFNALRSLRDKGVAFRLIVCGSSAERYPAVFDTAKAEFDPEILHFGFAESRDEYARLLARANILPVTNRQEFFGQSMAEAIAAGCRPILPDALAYPEHVPEAFRREVLYRSEGEFLQRLEQVCRGLSNETRVTAAMQERIMQYDWNHMIPVYDEAIDTMVNGVRQSGPDS